MKTSRMFFILIGSLICQFASGDIIPDNSHYVGKCVKITNLSEYKDVSMLGYVLYVGSTHQDTYIVSPEDCLTKGYKFNTLRLFVVPASYLDGKDIDKIDLPNDGHALEASLQPDPYAGYYPNSNPVDRIEEYYKILGFTDTSVVIFKWKEVIGYNNGTPDATRLFEYSGDASSLYPSLLAWSNNNKELPSGIQLFPNPAEKAIHAEITNSYMGNVQIQFFTAAGSLLSSSIVTKSSVVFNTTIPIENYTTGIYLVRFKLGELIETKRIILK